MATMNSVDANLGVVDSWAKSALIRRVDHFARSVTGISLTASSDDSSSSSLSLEQEFSSHDPENVNYSSSGSSNSGDETGGDSESVSQYFDCRQSIASLDDMLDIKAANDEDDDPYHDQVAMYTSRQCVYSDGTPAYVLPGRCRAIVPWEFLEAAHGNDTKAHAAWLATQEWRRQHNVWNRHTRPDPVFDHVKECYPSCYHGVSKTGFIVEYSFPGRMQARRLFYDDHAMDQLVQHHIFFQEFIANCMYKEGCVDVWQQMGKRPLESSSSNETPASKTVATQQGDECTGTINNNPSYGIFVVIDIQGAGVNLLSTDVVALVQRMANIDCHYPLMARRVLIINASFWTSAIFAALEHILPKTMTVEIVGERDSLSRLRKYVDDDQIPTQYGGSSPYSFFQHPMERRLKEMVNQTSGEVEPLAEPDHNNLIEDIHSIVAVAMDDADADAGGSLSDEDFYDDDATDNDDSSVTMCWHFAPLHREKIRIVQSPTKVGDPSSLAALAPHAVAHKFWRALTDGFGDSCTGRNPVL